MKDLDPRDKQTAIDYYDAEHDLNSQQRRQLALFFGTNTRLIMNASSLSFFGGCLIPFLFKKKRTLINPLHVVFAGIGVSWIVPFVLAKPIYSKNLKELKQQAEMAPSESMSSSISSLSSSYSVIPGSGFEPEPTTQPSSEFLSEPQSTEITGVNTTPQSSMTTTTSTRRPAQEPLPKLNSEEFKQVIKVIERTPNPIVKGLFWASYFDRSSKDDKYRLKDPRLINEGSEMLMVESPSNVSVDREQFNNGDGTGPNDGNWSRQKVGQGSSWDRVREGQVTINDFGDGRKDR
ncbi:unnamed protein product [Ambrosiozyma monospora]|uniref:Unnamed protein product n=1 Tax=Ambrosiozyma monospora TaxID=43982 RepID=A0ACB5SSP9_AMBMO|nr:unnamed protein product [Ambrosiozyma monospora]